MRLFDSSSIFVSPGSSLIHSCAMAWRDPNLTWEDMGRVGEGGASCVVWGFFGISILYVVVQFTVLKRTDRHINHRRGTRHTAQEATKLARARSLRREKALA